MRDADGIYIGVTACRHYLGIDRYSTKVCCGGGKTIRICFCRCELRGILDSELECSSSACDKREEIIGKLPPASV